MSRIAYSFVAFAAILCCSLELFAQTAQFPQIPSQTAEPVAPKAGEATKTAEEAEFDKVFEQFKSILKQLTILQNEYQTTPKAEQTAVQQKFEAHRAELDKLAPFLKAAAEKAFMANPKNPQATEMMLSLAVENVESEQANEALRIIDLLEKNQIDRRELQFMKAQLLWSHNEFAAAKAIFEKADKQASDAQTKAGLQHMTKYDEMWKTESAIRAAEAKANDLPRVKFSTTKGDIVIELFENEAPNAVANFISLIEKKFYDGTYFHRVLPNFMAQGGDPNTKNTNRADDGQGGPGYTIKCECSSPNARKHFRGSLSMAHAGKDTGGSQFFLTFNPIEHLDGKHTVFGRVIEGLDVLDKLQRIDPQDEAGSARIQPDVIKSAVVVRKRSHEYTPVTAPDPRAR